MAISHLKIKSFRNHKEKTISFNKGLTVIFGDNGSGKTSILEAIHLLSIGKSFKTNKKRELINKDQKAFLLNGLFVRDDFETNISMYVHKKEKEQIKINNKKILKKKELLNRNNVVVLSPEEQKITKGPPRERRMFFDKLFSICFKGYLTKLQDYNKVLKQRNAILKDPSSQKTTTLEQWDHLLIEKGINLWKEKSEKFKIFKELFFETTIEYNDRAEIYLDYKKTIISIKSYKEKLSKNIKRDALLKRTSFGPHLDDYTFSWNKKPIRTHGSEGENKTFLILLKLTELKYIKTTTNNSPILLLDDLFATIDFERSKKTISVLQELEIKNKKPIQTIVTTTDVLSLENLGYNFKDSTNKLYELRR